MLPVYDYIQDKHTGDLKPFDLMQEQNLFLSILNSQENINKLFERVGEVIAIAGEGFNTVDAIPTVERSETEAPLWVDGKPEPLDPERNDELGDNRVLLSSALFHFDTGGGGFSHIQPKNILVKFFTRLIKMAYAQFGGLPLNYREIIKNSSHGNLPYDAIPDIFSLLELNLGELPEPYPEFAQELIIMVGSPVNIKITDPDGHIVSQAQIDIPYAEFNKPPDSLGPKMIFIPNPIEGEYNIELEGLASGEYHLGIQVLSDSLNIFKEISGLESQTEKLLYSFSFDSHNLNTPLSEVNQIVKPENILFALNRFYNNGQIKHTPDGEMLKTQLLAKIKIIQAFYYQNLPFVNSTIKRQIKDAVNLIKKYQRKGVIENEAAQILIKMFQKLVV